MRTLWALPLLVLVQHTALLSDDADFPGFGADKIRRLREATVRVELKIGSAEQEERSFGSATGFFITSSGLVVTNDHVFRGRDKMLQMLDGQRDWTGSRTPFKTAYTEIDVVAERGPHPDRYRAKLVKRDPDYDLVILKVNGRGFTCLEVEKPSNVAAGQEILTFGYPGGVYIEGGGTILGVDAEAPSPRPEGGKSIDVVQYEAPTGRGSSGSALMNRSGKVVGIVFAEYVRPPLGKVAVPIKVLRRMAGSWVVREPAPKPKAVRRAPAPKTQEAVVVDTILKLKNGAKFSGKLVRQNDGEVVLQFEMGTMSFAREQIESIERKEAPK